MYRQGDILIVPVDGIPGTLTPAAREDGRIIVAHGVAAGDVHAIRGEGAALFTDAERSAAFLAVSDNGPAALSHPAHATIMLPPGSYRIFRQKSGVTRIASLTRQQQGRLEEYAARWTEIGLCTDPADRPRAEAAIRDMYRQGGLKPPEQIAWCGSPLSMALAHADMLEKQPAQIADGVRAGVADRLIADARGSVGACVRDCGWNSVLRDVKEKIEDEILKVWSSILDGIPESIESLADCIYGQHDAPWLGFYRYYHDVLDMTGQTGRLSCLWELAQSSGWALPRRNICWVSERHHVLARDGDGRLHSESGPACAWADGFAIYAVHGVRVPQYVVERPGEITLARIDGEPNLEVRRVMIDRYRHGEDVSGRGAYIRDGSVRLDHDERYGTLWRRKLPDEFDEPVVMVEVVNSTPEPDGSFKRYWLRVPPDVQTARDAVAWTFGLSGEEYDPVRET